MRILDKVRDVKTGKNITQPFLFFFYKDKHGATQPTAVS